MSFQAQSEIVSTHPPVQKFSRYRSVRKAAAEHPQSSPPNASISSAPVALRSRYHGLGNESPEAKLKSELHDSVPQIKSHFTSLAALEGKEYLPDQQDQKQSLEESKRDVAAVQEPQGHLQDAVRPISNSPTKRYQSYDRQNTENAQAQRILQHTEEIRMAPALEQQPTNGKRMGIVCSRPSSPHDLDLHGALNSQTPANDAPVSSVNAGKRKVTITWDDDTLELTVTPDTTARHVISAAAARLSRPNSTDLILIESFSQLGLERPIREYEHIRDIMNSWNGDDSNALMIKTRYPDSRASGLTMASAPPVQPDLASVTVYYSQRPDKWDNRYVTLRSDGQVMVAKKYGSETTNICHMSDFDVYVPTQRQIKNEIRPPRKCCLAIKSQQKSAVFLDGANFVHLFCTSDQTVANFWYDTAQNWRSWYLVNVLESGGGSKRSKSVRRRSSVNEGSPLVALASNPRSEPQLARAKTSKPSSRDRRTPPTSFPNSLDVSSGSTPGPSQPVCYDSDDNSFAPSGLLGRLYSVRKKSAGDIETSRPQSSSRPRPGSSRQTDTTKPVVHLTPMFQESPHHSRKGHSIGGVLGNPLIENARSPDHLSGNGPVPSATTWRRPDASLKSSLSMRRRSSTARQATHNANVAVDSASSPPRKDPFTGQGLLSTQAIKVAKAQGDHDTGRGIASYNGDPNDWDRPLLDVKMKSQFQDGSLLREVEKKMTGTGPVIQRQREKNVEGWVRVGEGF